MDIEDLDPRLRQLCRQIGPHAWNERVARAREREAVVLRIQRELAAGKSWREMAQGESLVSLETLKRWVQRHASGGLMGLIDRNGVLTTRGFEDAPPNPNKRRIQTRPALSFVKWVGSKQSVLPELLRRAPPLFGTYFEPMVGSGALFLGLKPKRAVLSDSNVELMLCYQVIRDQVDDLLAALRAHRNTAQHYHWVRGQDAAQLGRIERAARFIFLNKTCYNGLYRVNRSGRFNVPYGRAATANFVDEPTLRRISAQLREVELRQGDLTSGCAGAQPGDWVYFDPPYLTVKAARAIRYCAEGFGDREHRRLAQCARELDARGCYVTISNSDLPIVRQLYCGFLIEPIRLSRTVNADASKRGGWSELIIRNFDESGALLNSRKRRVASSPQIEMRWE